MDAKRSREIQTKTWMKNMRKDLAEKDMDLRVSLDTIKETEGGGDIL